MFYNSTNNFEYTLTDHASTTLSTGLGSITAIVNEQGNIVEEQSFDAWGRNRNPSDWSYDNAQPISLLFRGYTGHEMLPEFGLINMNGRMYDPVLGRMLSPDNYVQDPFFPQNYNRYAYAWNNPLKYTDPSGDFIGTAFTFLWDLGTTLFTKGGMDPWNTSENRREAWSNFDPTASWSKTNKAWRVDKGLIKTDPNKTTLGRAWELTSRFSWQLPQTMIGNAHAHISNVFYNKVNWVDYYGGATILNVDEVVWGQGARGVCLGNYISGVGISANPFEVNQWGERSEGARLLRHEYGHYIQSQVSGPLYFGKYGIPSASGADWTEVDAEYRSDQYFIKHYGTDLLYIGQRGGSDGTIVDPNEFLFITIRPDRYPPNYRPANPRWWEYAMFFSTGLIPGTLLLGYVFN